MFIIANPTAIFKTPDPAILIQQTWSNLIRQSVRDIQHYIFMLRIVHES